MKNLIKFVVLAGLAAGLACQVEAQGTAFTYQGVLNVAGAPANGGYDFNFEAWNALTGGTQIGVTEPFTNVEVSNGLFTVTLDFGDIFTGSGVWLEIFARPHGTPVLVELFPRQSATPAPYAIHAENTGTVPTVTTLNGSFSGDMTGTQAGTIVSKVGGQTAGSVSNGVAAALGAVSTNMPNTIVKMDGSGNFAANDITASFFDGRGQGFTSLNASHVAAGTGPLPSSIFGPTVAQVNSNQAFTGLNAFSSTVNFAPGNGTLSVSNDQSVVPGLLANGGNSPGHARFRNELEIWPNPSGTTNGYLDVRNTSGTPTITLTGQTGAMAATSFSGSGANVTGTTVVALGGSDITSIGGENGLSVGTNIFLNSLPIYLRGDQNHGLGYNGGGIAQPDGPVLWGYGGGALGVLNGGAAPALSWNNSGVAINKSLNVGGNATVGSTLQAGSMNLSGTITAPNNSGAAAIQAPYSTNAAQQIEVPSGQTVTLGYFNSDRPGPGYFVITAYANVSSAVLTLILNDTTSGSPVQLDSVVTSDGNLGSPAVTLSMVWVVPVPQTGGTEQYELQVNNSIYSNTGYVAGWCLNVMYFPRLND
jgi:hypothetical protein